MRWHDVEVCPECDGRGQVCPCGRPAGHPMSRDCRRSVAFAVTCRRCGGAGLVDAAEQAKRRTLPPNPTLRREQR